MYFFFSNMHECLYSLTPISCHVKFMNKTCIKVNVLLCEPEKTDKIMLLLHYLVMGMSKP